MCKVQTVKIRCAVWFPLLHHPRKPITCLDLVMKVMTRLFNSLSSQIKISRVATETLKADKKIKEKQTVLTRREGKFLRRLS